MRVGFYVVDERAERAYWDYAAGVLALFDAMARGPLPAGGRYAWIA